MQSDTLKNLRIIVDRFKVCPINIARSELSMFSNVINGDSNVFAMLQSIIQDEEHTIGARAGTIVNSSNAPPSVTDLSFADSPKTRAALGYQILNALLGSNINSDEFITCVLRMGGQYLPYQGNNYVDYLASQKVIADLFLEPIITYLSFGVDIEDELIFLLNRYKLRSEWFGLEYINLDMEENNTQTERQLKQDILKYLYDNRIDFSIESQAPPETGRVDILATINNWGQLPIEVKVFDGNGRDRNYVLSGLPQTADYARQFNQNKGYYVVFNIKTNSILRFQGLNVGRNIIKINIQGINILAISCNLNITLPSNKSSELTEISIDYSNPIQ